MAYQSELGLTLTKSRCSQYPAKYLSNIDYADNLTLLVDNIYDNLEGSAIEIGLYSNANTTEFIKFNQERKMKCSKEIILMKLMAFFIWVLLTN